MARLSIIIVNWNSKHQLLDCVSSIGAVRQDGFVLSDVVIVDNGSTDCSLEGIDQVGVIVRVIQNAKNLGFAAACNQGAKDVTGDYLLFLNPDTRLFEDSLAMPISFLQQSRNAGIGICGVRLVGESGIVTTSAARFPTLRVMAGKILGLANIFPQTFPPHLMSPSDMRESGVVDQVIGAFFLIRKNVFELCSGFDERFFVYFEEVDLSLRARQLGFSSYLLTDASAFHKGGGCSEQVKSARLFYSLRSRIIYAQKHYSLLEFVILIFLTGVELPLRLVQGGGRASWADMKSSLIAYKCLIAYLWNEFHGAD